MSGCQEQTPQTPTATVAAPAPEATASTAATLDSTLESLPTATPLPTVTSIPPTPTPESPSDFAALYDALAKLDSSAQVGDVLSALAESESFCLRKEMGDAEYAAVSGQSALAYATMAHIVSAPCIGPERGGDIMVAVMAEAIRELPTETEACIRDEVTDSYDAGSGGYLYGLFFLNCLNAEQFAALSASGIAVSAGSVSGDTRECLNEVLSAGLGAADRLGSGNPQDSMAITFIFQDAAIYGCLSNEQITVMAGGDAALSSSTMECFRYLYTQELPRLYNGIGSKMFGSKLDLSTEEAEAVDAFTGRRIECAEDPPAAYPTPEAPAPTLRPGVHSELRSVIGANASVEEIIAVFGADKTACIREELTKLSYQEADYERFLAMPMVALIDIPISLHDCFGERGMSIITVQAIIASAGIRNPDTETCLLKELAGLGSMQQGHLNFPRWLWDELYFGCMTEESYQNLVITHQSAYVGELPAHSEGCIREIAGDGFNIARHISNKQLHRDLSRLFEVAAHELCLDEEQFNAIYPPLPGDEVELPPNYLDCVRSIYDETVQKLQLEGDDSAWANGESPALDAFWDSIEGCAAQP